MTTDSPPTSYREANTLSFYDTNARSYSLARPARPSQEVLAFVNMLPSGSRVLELGCGSGIDAAAMEAMGFDVDATDGTASMVALATERLKRPARLLRFDELHAIGTCDGIFANASLLHVPLDRLGDVLAKIWTALKPGGWHFASYKTSGEPGPDQHGRYYNQLNREPAETLYRRAGEWSSVEFGEHDGVGYFSAPCRWLTVHALK